MIDERNEELAALYALDLLEGAERTDFESTLARDPSLQSLVRELRDSAAALAHTAPPIAPPAALKSRVLASLNARSVSTADNLIHPPSSAFRSLLPWAIAACFALAAAWTGQLYFSTRTESAILRQEQALTDVLLRSTRNQLDTERLLAQRRLADLAAQNTEVNRQLADASARLAASDQLVATTRSELENERGLSRQRTTELASQLAAEQSKSAEAARQIADAKSQLALVGNRLNEEVQRVAAIEAKARHDTDLANFKITTLASLLKNSPQALAIAVWNPTTQEGVLQVDKLPALAADKDYELWVVDPQYPNPVDGGVFTVDAKTGVARVNFNPKQPVKAINAFAVTLERKGGVPKAEGPFVLLGK